MPAVVIQAHSAVDQAPEPPGPSLCQPPAPRVPGLLCQPAVLLPALTFAALLLHGYHPYTDDAALYVAGIEKIVHPGIFPGHAQFVLPHLTHSVLSVVLGKMIRLLRIQTADALFCAYVGSLWLTLYSCWRLAKTLFLENRERRGAVLLITAALTMPVAGTAIFFIDPYLTARSFSTPLSLLAVAFTLERRLPAAVLCLAAAGCFHPLMAAYAVGYAVALLLIQQRRWSWLGLAAALVVLSGFAAQHYYMGHAVSFPYRMAADSRMYFFLDQWTWFEVFGLFPPLLAAFLVLRLRSTPYPTHLKSASAASLYTGAVAIVFAALFTRTPASFMLARLQPLRAFQIIYIVFFLVLGGFLGRWTFRRRLAWAGALPIVSIAVAMFLTQLYVYPSLRHVEWPWVQPKNPWEQAFLWIRNSTPVNAFFAIDPGYQSLPQEDAVGFRATTERGVLADWSKDGGVAAIDPGLAAQWWTQANAARNLNAWTDTQRIERLAPYGVDWIVLPATASTAFECPYRNRDVLVCRLPATRR